VLKKSPAGRPIPGRREISVPDPPGAGIFDTKQVTAAKAATFHLLTAGRLGTIPHMLPKTPLPQLLPPRITEALNRLKAGIWTVDPKPLAVQHSQPTSEHRTFKEAQKLKFTPITRTPLFWGRKFDQAWFKVRLRDPQPGRTRYLVWKDQGEATIYVDDLPWHGIDSAHPRAPLPGGIRNVWIQSHCCNTGIWAPGPMGVDDKGSRFEGAYLAFRDEKMWEAYHDLNVLMDVLRAEFEPYLGHEDEWGKFGEASWGYRHSYDQISPFFRRLLLRLDRAIDVFDNEGVEKLLPMLKQIYRDFPSENTNITCILTGHAHMDLVWRWPEKAGESKVIHSCATANRLMELYPEFRFSFTQPAGYDGIARRAPRLLAEIRKRIKEGQWEATGAAEVEMDNQLLCGENLARTFMVGQEGFKDLTGAPSRVLWIPDVFGYSASLPQILKATGVEFFFTSKLTWGSVTRFPYSSFRWLGHDGSEVLAHITQTFGYNESTQPDRIRKGANGYLQADVHDEFLCPTGYGDGGGGTTDEMCERARRLANMASVPKIRWGRIDEYFEGLAEIRDELPSYQGELFLEFHRGVQTTHGDLKATFRRLERCLQIFEAARCVTTGEKIDLHYWKRLLFAQHHDYIPGSSIHEVYEEGVPELKELGDRALTEAAEDLGKHKGSASLFNPLPYPRTVIHGNGAKRARYALPPLAARSLNEARLQTADKAVRVSERRLQNERLDARFDAKGQITKLIVDGQPVQLKGKGAQLVTYQDHPAAFDAWDIDRHTLSNGVRVTTPAIVAIAEDSNEQAVLAFTRALGEKSSVTIRHILEADSPVLRIEYDLDWQDPQTLLKVIFPTDYHGRQARFGAPFGSTLRGQLPGEPRDEARFEVPASRYAIVSDDTEDEGLFIVTEAKYGFTCYQGCLQLSLVRSAFVTEAGTQMELRNVKSKSLYSDMGRHLIRIAVGRHSSDAVREEQPSALADILFTPCVPFDGRANDCGFLGLEGGDSLQPAWAMPVKRGTWALRLSEALGRHGTAKIRLVDGWQAEPADIYGVPTGKPLPGNRIKFRPYELLTLCISRRA
jgi:alpha-mannosidase